MTRRLEILGTVATVLAVVGVVLNNHKVIHCFLFWLISNSLTLYLHLRGRMWSLAVRDAVFLGLAVAGWFQWRAA
jgi:nicotinamide riboside transporter PnuC